MRDGLDLLLYSGSDFIHKSFDQNKEIKLTNNHILRYFKDLDENEVYSGVEILSEHTIGDYIAFSWGCQIGVDNLKNIRFFEGIMAEDALFAPILIANSLRVGIIKRNFYKRLIRPFSITDFGCCHTKKTLPQSLGDIYAEIEDDILTKNYYLAYSCVCICSELHSWFVDSKKYNHKIMQQIRKIILGRIFMAFYALHFDADPRDARSKLKNLECYICEVGWSSKLAYHFPRIFRILKKLKMMIKR